MTMLKRLSASSIIALAAALAAYTVHAQTAKPQTAAPKASAAAPAAAPSQGPRPEQFKFPPLAFKPPKPADFRATLSNGLVVYIAEDHQIPWFEATLLTPVAGGGGGGGRGRGAEARTCCRRGRPAAAGGRAPFSSRATSWESRT